MTRGRGLRSRLRWLLPAGLLLWMAVALAAQAPGGRGFGRFRGRTIRRGLPEHREGFMFCRLTYTSSRREAGGTGWTTDYPGAEHNFMIRLAELTLSRISHWEDGEPGYTVVSPTDPLLFRCPFVMASDVGTAVFTEEEATRLREFLLKGGMLWVDDFWGDASWAQWSREMARVLPGYPIVDLPLDHPLFSVYYSVRKVPQLSSIQFWRATGGETSERGAESATPHLRAILDGKGRPLVVMSFDTDIADGWEREGEDNTYFELFSPAAYGVGINVALYAMSH